MLLGNRENIVCQPVQHQSGGKIDKNKGENNRHEHHHFRLGGIPHRRGHFLLQQHGGAHDYRQDRNAVRRLHKGDMLDREVAQAVRRRPQRAAAT